ncbi:MAG: PEP-CTERM sorting domain-containing protein [Akkermansiaceae bacterium]|nr:PEP-CTERM sorting domain-containing protein [Akkermansiaceae bacterium]
MKPVKKMKLINTAAMLALTLPVLAQNHTLEFTDANWKNSSTGNTSEFLSNGSGRRNSAGWDASHTLANVDSSGIGATLEISHQPNAWNIENRPALATYFPSNSGSAGDILRSWNNESNIPNGEIPKFTLTFDSTVALFQISLEGFRGDDAWLVQAYDASGNLVAPNWANANQATVTNPGAALGNTAINLLSKTGVNGATGAEALAAGKYDRSNKGFTVWNQDNVFERGAAILDYNGAHINKLVYSMIEVDTADGTPTGAPADQSMYIGSGIVFQQVPEPSSAALLGLGGIGILLRRRR